MLIAVLVASIFGVTIPASTAQTPEYLKGEGVLDSDNYILYPYDESKSLSFGVSAYGEPIYAEPIIDPATGKLKADYSDYIDQCVGLKYDGYPDVFCNPIVPPTSWCNGWLINITYVKNGMYENIWAYALFSDTLNGEDSVAGPWHRASSPTSDDPADLGGRRWGGTVEGYVESKDPIVLYDGPRKKIILLETDIYESPGGQLLVQLYFTVIFNKVKKYVVWIKDVKRPEQPKGYGVMQVEFSERGQWDIVTTGQGTVYSYFFNDNETKYYKHPWYYNETAGVVAAGYDVCQMFNPDLGYVGFYAFWPNLTTKWVESFTHTPLEVRLCSLETYEDVWGPLTGTVGGFELSHNAIAYPRGDTSGEGVVEWDDTPMVFVNDVQMAPGEEFIWSPPNTVTFTPGNEPGAGDVVKIVYKCHRYQRDNPVWDGAIPFVVGEWDFDLLNPWENPQQWAHFRCVTVYGLVDLHDAEDTDEGVDRTGDGRATDNLDREIVFQLDEVFNPWDLQDAVEKKTERQVYKEELAGDTNTIQLPHSTTTHHKLYTASATWPVWDEYCSFAERVLVKEPTWTEFKLVPRSGCENDDPNDAPFTYTLYDDGRIVFSETLPAGTLVKVLYSTVRDVEKVDEFTFVEDPVGEDDLGYTYKHYFHYPNVKDVKFLMGRSDSGWVKLDRSTYWDIEWIDFGPYKSIPVLVWTGDGAPDYSYDKFKVVYDCELGRYEWNVVGRFSGAVDSAGAAMVTEAFEEWKNIQVVDSAMDMQETRWASQPVPFVLANMGGDRDPEWWTEVAERNSYYDNPTTNRLYLKDDWCCKVPPLTTCSSKTPGVLPISSANLISVASPWANALTEYFNDFTDALLIVSHFWGKSDLYTYYGYGCWDSRKWLDPDNAYWSDYAVVATYKDLNGTIGFIVQGGDGKDTYYACWALRHGLIEYLNFIQPGVTALILKIDYTTHPPHISVVESLGTITECSGFDHMSWVDTDSDGIDDQPYAYEIIRTIATEKCISDKLVKFCWPSLHPDP